MRLRDNFISGTLGGDIGDSNTAVHLLGFSALSYSTFTESDDDYAVVTIDPEGRNNGPEIVHVTESDSDAATPDDSVTVVRGREGTTAVAHSVDDAWVHAPTRRDYYPPSNPRTYDDMDDEFIDTTLDASWTLVEDTSPNVTTKVGGGKLSMYLPGGDGSGDYHAYMKSLGSLTYPLAIEARFSGFHGGHDTGASFAFGVVVADGISWGSGSQVSANITINTNDTEGKVQYDLRDWTGYNTYISQKAQTGVNNHSHSDLYVRLYWTAANTWKAQCSVDGISWMSAANLTSTWAKTLTPTYAGIWASGYGAANQQQLAVDHFRVYDPS